MTNQSNSRSIIIGVVAFVVGVLIGWFPLNFVFPSFDWTNTDFTKLRGDLKSQYVEMVANSFAANGDINEASTWLKGLGPEAQNILNATAQETAGNGSPNAGRVAVLKQNIDAAWGANPPTFAAPPGNPFLIPFLCGLLVVVVSLVGGYFILRRGSSISARPTGGRVMPAPPPPELDEAGVPIPVSTPTGSPAVARFMTTYTLGDDVYDDSFSIDGPDGNFLGECGMGISETIGVGDPKKVTAFEVWLFDKNDIRTVTKVIMSEHAFRDEALKSRLSAKGEPMQAAPGETVTLETQTLIITARIVDMGYGGGALPPGSFFERMTIELQAYRKQAPAA